MVGLPLGYSFHTAENFFLWRSRIISKGFINQRDGISITARKKDHGFHSAEYGGWVCMGRGVSPLPSKKRIIYGFAQKISEI